MQITVNKYILKVTMKAFDDFKTSNGSISWVRYWGPVTKFQVTKFDCFSLFYGLSKILSHHVPPECVGNSQNGGF